MKKILLILILGMFLISSASAVNQVLYGVNESNTAQQIPILLTDTGVVKTDINFSTTNQWSTNIGLLTDVNDTQFSNNGNVLNIVESWLDSLWCRLTGCEMTGNLIVIGAINSTDWTNVSIASSQVTDFQSIINNGTYVIDSVLNNGSYLNTLGLKNSTSWNRSGTDVFLANIGDNVGIGTTTPESVLHIIGGGSLSGSLMMSNLDNAAGIILEGIRPGIRFNETDSIDVNFQMDPIAGIMRFGVNNDAFGSFVPIMSLDLNNQRVGIGTPSPEQILDVAGGWIEIDNAKALLGEDSGGVGRGLIGIESTDDVIIGSSNLDSIRFDVAGVADAMFIEETSGEVGIGTDSPDAKLEIEDGINNSFAVAVRISNKIADDATGESVGILFDVEKGTNRAKGGIAFEDTGSWGRGSLHLLNNIIAGDNDATLSDAKLTIDINGNVGIGTTSPAHKLHLGATTAEIAELGFAVVGGGAVPSTSLSYPIIYGSTNGGSFPNDQAGRLVLQPRSNSGTGDDIIFLGNSGGVDMVLVGASGNLGIGTIDPTKKLEVAGAIMANRSFVIAPLTTFDELVLSGNEANVGINILSQDNGNGGIIFGDASDVDIGRIIYVHNGNSLDFYTSNALQMEIQADGGIVFPNIATTTEVDNACFRSTGELTREVDGTCESSSLSVKHDVSNLTYGIDDIMKLRPIFFKYNLDIKPTFQETRTGFVAEEMFKVIPEVVTHEFYDETGLGKGKIEGIDYSKLSAVLVAGIQDLKKENDLLELELNQTRTEMCENLPLINWSWC